ncbi:hypothetical protein [Mesorhizobium sp. M8A.F.Ca.ET.165.01.1.1]|uniref:hypothetical protein n=1 Tax=Mesorhizobium sp. M8A.F.Ca.ET.165.01.1.1 TaxID=2563960 RepID=UPI001093E4EB|nr:hypothetical protein [Mesorhizobium sp. M8A.F.Ca.ET.165.01.1.1]TGT42625.1 hypothetical protein EN808_12080 [Mesorhizobium sp. M8A.F.Ca.ET.165.01.1.1]
MQTLPETRKPPTRDGSLEISNSLAAFDTGDNTEALRFRQASRIITRFPMSVPLALATARLAYGGGA